MTNRVGQQLGNYKLISLLGEGGFAEVYLGEHIHLGTNAAIKVLHTQLTGDDIEQFRTEARTIAHLEHPHIVRILDFGVEGKTPFLVMSFAPYGTLRQRHPKGEQLPLSAIVSYVQQVADALQYAHEEKLIHRDIKPENMLLGRRHEVLLSDFGIATVTVSSRYQSTQDVIGTVAYMAPEQIQGKPRPASDQYSLGIVVYEWVSGDRPFHGSFTELCAQHMFAPLPPLREKVPEVPLEVEQVVQTALAKDPKERFQTIQAFATALEQAVQSTRSGLPMNASMPTQPSSSVQATPPSASQTLPPTVITPSLPPSQPLLPTQLASPPGHSPSASDEAPSSLVAWFSEASQSRSQPSRHSISRREVLVGLAGLAVVAGGSIWLALARKQQGSPPSSGSSSSPLGTTLLIYHGHSSYVNAVAWSPDGKKLASASDDKTVQIWDAASGDMLLTYRGHDNSVRGVLTVQWSPDGRSIASGGTDNTVQVWDAISGNTVYTYRGHSQEVNAVAWAPGGKRIASASTDGTVQVWDATTGSNVFTYPNQPHLFLSVAWSPNGQDIASAAGEGVWVWDATTGSNIYSYPSSTATVFWVGWSSDGKYFAYGDQNLSVYVQDATTGMNIFTNHGVSGVAWAPTGTHIASRRSEDGAVWIWDATTGNTVFIYHSNSQAVPTLAWAPDGRRIASAAADNSVRVWQAG